MKKKKKRKRRTPLEIQNLCCVLHIRNFDFVSMFLTRQDLILRNIRHNNFVSY